MMGYLVVSAGTATHLSSRNVGCCCPEREKVSKSEIFNEQEGDTMEMIVIKDVSFSSSKTKAENLS
jgi:hypothetical protein